MTSALVTYGTETFFVLSAAHDCPEGGRTCVEPATFEQIDMTQPETQYAAICLRFPQ